MELLVEPAYETSLHKTLQSLGFGRFLGGNILVLEGTLQHHRNRNHSAPVPNNVLLWGKPNTQLVSEAS